MTPIDELNEIISAFAKTLQNIGSDAEHFPRLLTDPAGLVALIKNGETRRLANSAALKIPIPRFCIFSVTWRCNLNCIGCYAKGYATQGTLDLQQIDRIVREASDLGSFIFIIAGGEPLAVPGLLSVLSKVQNAFFFVFTNGTLFSDKHIEQLECTKNLMPIFSIEGDIAMTDARRGHGTARKIQDAMSRLYASRVAFGFSTMVTHLNVQYVTSRRWMDEIWNCGARFGFLIDYIPFEFNLDPEMVLTDADLALKAQELAKRNAEAKPLALNFPPDEYQGAGCQSAGKGFLHVNADGFVEPCPFCHYAADNLKEKPLREILRSPFLSSLRETFEQDLNYRGTCMLFAKAEMVKSIAAETGARRTDLDQSRNPSPAQVVRGGGEKDCSLREGE